MGDLWYKGPYVANKHNVPSDVISLRGVFEGDFGKGNNESRHYQFLFKQKNGTLVVITPRMY